MNEVRVYDKNMNLKKIITTAEHWQSFKNDGGAGSRSLRRKSNAEAKSVMTKNKPEVE